MIAGAILIIATLIFIAMAVADEDHPACKPEPQPDPWCSDCFAPTGTCICSTEIASVESSLLGGKEEV